MTFGQKTFGKMSLNRVEEEGETRKRIFLSDKTNESRIGKKSSNRQLIIWIELFVPFAFSMLQILMIAAAELGEKKRGKAVSRNRLAAAGLQKNCFI